VPSGKYRCVVHHASAKRDHQAVAMVAEAKLLETKLKLKMGSTANSRERHTVSDATPLALDAISTEL
jgi:hypothetical protein